MAEVTAGICSWSPITHRTTAPSMVALIMRSSRDIGPICRSFSFACFGASGVSFTSGGTSCGEHALDDQYSHCHLSIIVAACVVGQDFCQSHACMCFQACFGSKLSQHHKTDRSCIIAKAQCI